MTQDAGRPAKTRFPDAAGGAHGLNEPSWRRLVEAGYGSHRERTHYGSIEDSRLTFAESQLVDRYVPLKGTILVIGSGGGRELEALSPTGRVAVGLDVSRSLVQEYVTRRGTHASPVVRADMARIPMRAATFDAVLFFNQVIGHGPSRRNRIAALAEALRVLRPGGTILVSFYVGSQEDFSVFLAAWTRYRRAAPRVKGIRFSIGSSGKKHLSQVLLHVRAWARGKWNRALGISGLGRIGRDVLIAPSGDAGGTTESLVPFHLYTLDEFFEDATRAGAKVALWTSNSELNAGASLPTVLRALDHLHFCVLRRRQHVRAERTG